MRLQEKLNGNNAQPADDDTYTTIQIVEALYGSMAKAQLDHVLAQTEALRLTNASKRAELLDRIAVTGALENIFIAMRNIIEGSALAESEKRDLFSNMATWPVLLANVAEQQSVEA